MYVYICMCARICCVCVCVCVLCCVICMCVLLCLRVVYFLLKKNFCHFYQVSSPAPLNCSCLDQVLEAARFSRPYTDTYYHKRDHTLLLALHNPVGPNSQSSLSWQSKLHSNVGFRNYLEHVVDSIKDWVQEEERLRKEATRTPTPPPPVLEPPTIPLKVGSRYGLMTRTEVAAIKAEEEEKSKKGKGRKSARSRTPKRSAKTREKSESPEKKDKGRKTLVQKPQPNCSL